MIMPSCDGQFHEVAVAPDAGKALEVRGTVFGAVGIVPESDRHRGEGRRADQFALLARARACHLVVDVHSQPQPAALQLTAPYRPGRAAQSEAGNDVRAAGNRRQAQIGLDALVDVVEALGRERASGRQHRAQRAPARSPCAAPGRPSSAHRCTWRKCRSASCAPVRQAPRESARDRRTGGRRTAASVAPDASPDTSQFHIIQPQVVK